MATVAIKPLTGDELGQREVILVVEELSPTDDVTRVNRRVSQFLKRGVALVWLVDPEVRCVTVYRADRYPVVLDQPEDLLGDDVLPDFRCRVADFFARPGQPGTPSGDPG
jgi:Uma2 family endonuclease